MGEPVDVSINPLHIKSYPVFETRTFQPIDQPMSAVQAKRLLRELLRDSGCFDRLDLQMLVELFAVDLQERGRSLREELALLKSEIRDKLAANQEDAENLADAIPDAQSEDEVAAIKEQIALTKLRSISAKRRIAETAEELDAFKRDKRQFLVDQLNNLFHGIAKTPRLPAS
jgi:hypothetical protein